MLITTGHQKVQTDKMKAYRKHGWQQQQYNYWTGNSWFSLQPTFLLDLPPLGLMQEVPQLYTEGRASSYHFMHSTLQEYLAAVYVSQLPAHDQTGLFQEHLDSGHFKMTLRFLAGFTKLANIPPDITRKLMENSNTKLTYFHFLFEAKNISTTTRTLGSDVMVVSPHYSWTPLNYYVTGHAISHSNCPWNLGFFGSSIDDNKFELFCQGCAAPEENWMQGQHLKCLLQRQWHHVQKHTIIY